MLRIQILLLAALALSSLCAGRITHREVDRDGRMFIEIEVPFVFSDEGHVELIVKRTQVFRDGGDRSNMGFFLLGTDKMELPSDGDSCVLRSPSIKKLVTFDQGVPEKKGDPQKEVKYVFKAGEGGQYKLSFANCDYKSTAVSFKIKVTMYNINANGKRDYLSMGEQELPTLYLVMFLLFSFLAAAWLYICVKEKQNVHKIHLLMFLLIVLRALTLFTQAMMYHYDRVTGNPLGWNIVYYIFTFFRGVMFFTVIVLVGTGWSYLRPFIGEKEKKILVVVIPLQVFANIAIIIMDETSPVRTNWIQFKDMFHLVDIICCCAILFPIVWSIKHLREGAESDGKAVANIEKLTLFRQFYVVVVVYIYFTRIIVYLLENTVSFEYTWTSALASELATLIFYVIVGMKFRPHTENKYFKLQDEDAKATI